MPTSNLIDIDALLLPLPGENPAGDSVPFVLRKKLEDARKEVNPESFAEDDPRRPEQPIVADWGALERLTQDTLCKTSKDLLVAARLTEALTKRHGFAGVRDGLTLMRRMVAECWDRVNPPIEDGDLEPRGAAFNWLGDPARGAFFPNTVRQVPLVRNEADGYGWQTWRDVQDGKGKIDRPTFEKAIAAAKREDCQTVVDDLQSSLEVVEALGRLLDEKLGDLSPSLEAIRTGLLDAQVLAQEILSRKGPAPVAFVPEDEPSVGAEQVVAAASNGQKGTAERRPSTREELYARLAEVAEQLMRMEPHSPVGYMVQRAVKLGQLPLPELMRVLVRDPAVLTQLDRDLDLGYEQPAE
jgi:type VI secretion system protein ImpA